MPSKGWRQFFQQRMRDAVFRHPQADRLARRMAQTARHFLGGFQDERVRAGRGGLQHAELAIVDPRIQRDFTQIAAQQSQKMLVVDAADAAQALDRMLVVEMAHQRVAGIGRQGDDAAGMDDLRGLLDQAQLRIVWMQLEKLAHGGKRKRRQPKAAVVLLTSGLRTTANLFQCRASAAMRASIGGWVENSAAKPGLSLIPDAAIDFGNSPGSIPPRRASAFTIGSVLPSSFAEPASARNSRWRENQATMIDASKPNTVRRQIPSPCNRCRGRDRYCRCETRALSIA